MVERGKLISNQLKIGLHESHLNFKVPNLLREVI